MTFSFVVSKGLRNDRHNFFHLSDCSLPTLHEQTHEVAQQPTTVCWRAQGLWKLLGSGGREQCWGKTCPCFPSDGDDIMMPRKKERVISSLFMSWLLLYLAHSCAGMWRSRERQG